LKNVTVEKYFADKADQWDSYYKPSCKTNIYDADEFNRRKELVFDFIQNRNYGNSVKAIDVGCGTGHYVNELIHHGFTAYGVDISKKMVEAAQLNFKGENDSNERFLCANCDYLPFPNDYFDVILCIGVLSYVSDEVAVLRELQRVAVKEGAIIFSFPNVLRFRNMVDPYYYIIRIWKYVWLISSNLISTKKKVVNISNSEQNFLQKRYTFNNVKSIIENAGLDNVLIRGFGFGPFRFWRKDLLPYTISIKISRFLERLQDVKIFKFLTTFASQWVMYYKGEDI
jgi:ubiquinone/menaquinone biosynthesis C-methylase UbiE